MDGKNINCHIVYDEDNVWPLELSSGMERFISSLAIRVGLINVSNLPASDFLAIDEGWGTMDSENLNSVYNLFQFLKSQFKFTMITKTEVIKLITKKIPSSQVFVENLKGNDHLQVTVIASEFNGLSLVKQHQLVYSALKEELASEAIHALALKTETPN